MHTLTIRRRLKAPADYLFDSFADATRLARLKGVQRVDELTLGHHERYGVGMQRRVQFARGLWMQEEVLEYDRPDSWTYRIMAARVGGFHHESGRLLFDPLPSGTQVTWTTTFTVPIPLVGTVVERLAGAGLNRWFQRVLTNMDQQYVADRAARHEHA
nr:SRPBCC family protein [Kibdelosporangium sp. MJ126-NF4]CEL20551.1 hypothetical protein [Kibdelosporangium sp. MJ126-NF4]CTQ89462.1 hypothetical protein [Kibdelosporangium sp. MJ126-NF4]